MDEDMFDLYPQNQNVVSNNVAAPPKDDIRTVLAGMAMVYALACFPPVVAVVWVAACRYVF